MIEQQEASLLCKSAPEWDVCCTDVKEIKRVVFVSGTNCSFWLLAWMCNLNPLGSCCTGMQLYDGTKAPGEPYSHFLTGCLHLEELQNPFVAGVR